MASRFMRFFNAPEGSGEGTIFTMSMSATEAVDRYEFHEYCVQQGVTITELDPDDYVCRDESGCRMSFKEVLLQPPLTDDQVLALGRLTAHHLVDGGNNSVFAVDCRADPANKYAPVIAEG